MGVSYDCGLSDLVIEHYVDGQLDVSKETRAHSHARPICRRHQEKLCRVS